MGSTEADGSEERVWLGILNRIIICFDCEWKKYIQRWFREEENKEKRKWEASFSWDSIWCGLSLYPLVFWGFLFVSGGITQTMGELSDGNTDINLPEHAGPIERHQSSALSTWSVIRQELRDVVLEMQCPLIIHAWETVDNLCSHFIKHLGVLLVFRSRISPANGCLHSSYHSCLFIINLLTDRKIYFF